MRPLIECGGERGVRLRLALGTEQHLLQGVREGADRELGHRPQEIDASPRWAAAVRMAFWSRASEPASKEPASSPPASITWWIWSAGPPAPPRANSTHSCSSTGLSTAVGIGIGSPARAGMPFLSLAAR